jgi:KDO2-lipid IV(A) lauroyltransferase
METERAPRTNVHPADKRPAGPARAPRRSTKIWQRLVLVLLRGAGEGIQSLSGPASVRLGTGLGSLAYRVAGRQRRRSLANLHLAYGDALSPSQREVLTREVFQHFGRGLVDFLRAPARSWADLSRLVSCEGWEHVEAARARGRGVVLVSAHLGNWEALGRWLATVKGLPLTVVAREPENPALGAYMRTMRERAGFKVLSKGESARGLLGALKRGEAVLILADQNSGDVFVPFFGVPAGAAAGPATLALRSGAALVPVYCLEADDHSLRVVCRPPLTTPEDTGAHAAGATAERAGRADEVVRVTAELNADLEAMVRAHPEQWLWLHNRWKSAFAWENRERAWPETRSTVPDFATALTRWSA